MASTVDLIYFNAGGGHRAAASALESVIRQQQRPWRVRPLNLVDVLDPRGLFRQMTGMAPEDLYNQRLARGWTLGLSQELKVLQAMIRAGHGPMHRRLTRHWRSTSPDLVVSLVPNFNRVMYESLAEARPGVPYVTLMTDMADHPPHFWIEPGQRQHLICGTATAMAQGRAAGYAEHQLHRCSGMLIRPDFYAPLAVDRDMERSRMGLAPDTPIGLVLFGGHGSRAMLSIAAQLPDRPLILLCGHNAKLARQLAQQAASAPRWIVGYTQDVRRYMALADYFIGKPGPGCLSEAVQQGLPVVTVCNAFTMPQERFNAQWVQDHGLGVVARSFRHMAPAVRAVLDNLPRYRQQVAGMRNRAIFEVPEILAGIMAEACCVQ